MNFSKQLLYITSVGVLILLFVFYYVLQPKWEIYLQLKTTYEELRNKLQQNSIKRHAQQKTFRTNKLIELEKFIRIMLHDNKNFSVKYLRDMKIDEKTYPLFNVELFDNLTPVVGLLQKLSQTFVFVKYSYVLINNKFKFSASFIPVKKYHSSKTLLGITQNPFCTAYSSLKFTDNPLLQVSPADVRANGLKIELKEVSLVDAIQTLAKILNKNIIISDDVKGTTTLNLHNASPQAVFDLLLMSHGLGIWQVGNVLYISYKKDLMQQSQKELQFQQNNFYRLPLVTKMFRVRYAKVEDIATILRADKNSFLSNRGRLYIDKRSNFIGIQDVATHLQKISNIIQQLDIPIKQILIEARIASVDYDYEKEIGISFNSENKNAKTDLTMSGRFSLAALKLADGSLLDIKLSALEKSGHAEIISSPSLFTANQQQAFIESGEEVPYQEFSQGGGTAVTFKKAVLGLKVTPQILPEEKVLLELKINQDRPSNRMVQGVPTISTREIVTNVLVKNGQTIVLGGIYENNNENGILDVPYISKLPIIGLLFSQKHIRQNKRELLIFVTPKIL